MLFRTLQPRIFHIFHPRLWSKLWSENASRSKPETLYRPRTGSVVCGQYHNSAGEIMQVLSAGRGNRYPAVNKEMACKEPQDFIRLHFIGRVNLHLGYVLQPQNCPYFPRRRTSSLPQNGHFSLTSSMCCCFSASLLLVSGWSFCTSCNISSGEYIFTDERSCERSFFSISGRRTITT